jgi:hypothetical protein
LKQNAGILFQASYSKSPTSASLSRRSSSFREGQFDVIARSNTDYRRSRMGLWNQFNILDLCGIERFGNLAFFSVKDDDVTQHLSLPQPNIYPLIAHPGFRQSH